MSGKKLIPKKDLKHGAYYRGRCRHGGLARWNEFDQHFYYWREKCNKFFVDRIRHREDDDVLDVFDAFEEVAVPNQEIPFN